MKKYFAFMSIGLLLLSLTAITVAIAAPETTAAEPELFAEPMLIAEPVLISEPTLIAEKIAADGYYQDMLYPEIEKEIVPLLVDPGYSYLRIKPGESDEMTVVLFNHGKEPLTLEPYIAPKVFSDNMLDEDWVTISPAKAELKSGEKQEFTIKVSVPEDAALDNYDANVFFSDLEGDVAALYPGYNGALELSVNVWLPPNVQIFNSYINDRVEAGSEYEYVIKLKNVAEKAISINPEFEVSEDDWYGYNAQVSLDEKDVTITAPSVIKAGEKTTVTVKVRVPADAEGNLNGRINLNIDDRTMNEWSQKVSINLDVWQQPEDPFTTSFVARTDDPVTLKIISRDYNYGGSSTSSTAPSFDVVLKNADGQVKSVLISTGHSSTVSLSQQSPIYYGIAMDEARDRAMSEMPVSSDDQDDEQFNVYQQGSTTYTEVYLADGAVGEWTLEIMPHNTENFEYSVNIGPVD
ncbi:COG1470 family protein [Methanococcoides alaskense]|uniref:NPCBM-associated, NEW3 domain of alpha-galactosidase n=1 Tax=Methanococcoides alaskense TaxID=325778 RepID=A0AA90U247_9EURY|nr:hypothetical protein [Methanococcoides alaskense]MDA0524355.1 hypothetical protein [Methanococcoides alaskense]MDR6223918.1 hypothetical protein [Methanococcoides alaskense]